VRRASNVIGAFVFGDVQFDRDWFSADHLGNDVLIGQGRALLEGVAYKEIARKFSKYKFSYGSVGRHRRHLLPDDLIRKAPPPEPEVALSLVQRIENLVAESKQIAAAAKTQQAWIAATSALREIRACLELLGKLSGEISPGNINFDNFNFATLTDDQIGAFLDAVAKRGDDRIRAMVTAKLGSTLPTVHVNFVDATVERVGSNLENLVNRIAARSERPDPPQL
jgi:hypothetical protein